MMSTFMSHHHFKEIICFSRILPGILALWYRMVFQRKQHRQAFVLSENYSAKLKSLLWQKHIRMQQVFIFNIRPFRINRCKKIQTLISIQISKPDMLPSSAILTWENPDRKS